MPLEDVGGVTSEMIIQPLLLFPQLLNGFVERLVEQRDFSGNLTLGNGPVGTPLLFRFEDDGLGDGHAGGY